MTAINLELVTYEGLDERIVVIRAGDEVDSVFVATNRFNVLIDTLATPSLCARALDLLSGRLPDRPLLVVNSHMNWDHYWGNAALDRATPIIAHDAALDRLRSPEFGEELAAKRAQEARFQNVEIVPPTMTFSGESLSLHGGDLTLELFHTPGHTPDHIAVWIPELRTCLAVDAVEHPIPEVWSRSPEDLRSLCSSLKKIRDLRPLCVVLAHGQTARPEVVDENLAYFARLRDAATKLHSDLPTPDDLSNQPGFRLEDFVALASDMSAETKTFYRQCHRSNLAAVLAARASGVQFV